MKSHGGNYTSPAELRQRGVLTNLHKTVCAVLSKITLDDLRLLRDFPEEDSLKIQVKKKEERLPSFRFLLYRLRSKAATTRGAHRGIQAPVPCTYYVSAEYRLPVEFGLAICFRLRTFLPISRAASHKA